MDNSTIKEQFNQYLQIEKNVSPYTLKYYNQDLDDLNLFLQQENISKYSDVDDRVVRFFLTYLYQKKLSRKSVARKISSLRTFSNILNEKKLSPAILF